MSKLSFASPVMRGDILPSLGQVMRSSHKSFPFNIQKVSGQFIKWC